MSVYSITHLYFEIFLLNIWNSEWNDDHIARASEHVVALFYCLSATGSCQLLVKFPDIVDYSQHDGVKGLTVFR